MRTACSFSVRWAGCTTDMAGVHGGTLGMAGGHRWGSGLPHVRCAELACSADDMHPQDRTGHRALADLFVGFVRATAVDLANRPLGKADEEIAQAS